MRDVEERHPRLVAVLDWLTIAVYVLALLSILAVVVLPLLLG